MRTVWFFVAMPWLLLAVFLLLACTLRVDDVVPETGNPYQTFTLTHDFPVDRATDH